MFHFSTIVKGLSLKKKIVNDKIYYQKLFEDIFFLGSIFCLSSSQEDARFVKSLAKGHFFCHPLHLEVIIWSNIISSLAYNSSTV